MKDKNNPPLIKIPNKPQFVVVSDDSGSEISFVSESVKLSDSHNSGSSSEREVHNR